MPYCTGVHAEDYPASEGGHIFSGGNWDRDWPTLFDAIRGLNVEVRIAAARKTVPVDIAPPNVTLLGGVSADEFHRQLASATLVVLSLRDLGLRLPGIRTYVAAMRLGKCVILNDPVGARSYIQDGVTGVLVPPKDPEALRSAIAKLLHNAELRSTIANSARSFAARHFTMEMYFNRIREVLREVRQ
jgi:glycosyltransferase involved in cell wall biosynthesis